VPGASIRSWPWRELERCGRSSRAGAEQSAAGPGESGVGKTAIAEGLAKRIVDGDVPDVLRSSVVYSLDLGSLPRRHEVPGDFEKRFKGCSGLKKKRHSILFNRRDPPRSSAPAPPRVAS